MYPIRYLPTGHIFIDPYDDCDKVVDAMLETGYGEEFCLARDFEEDFVSRLMQAGFLVMSTELRDEFPEGITGEKFFILLPKLHLERSVLFFPELHIKKTIRRFIPRYELRVNTNFNLVFDKCVKTHGEAWLTPPLVKIIKNLWEREDSLIKPVSFEVYRDGQLKAGEIGIVMGRVYTSYTGYHEEDNAGTVQMILMVKWLKEAGFDFLDFGMPLDYKLSLGAQNVNPDLFVKLFRGSRY